MEKKHGLRIGTGYDIHRLVPGRKLILGGVEIPYHKGLDGHSDADVLVHALIDALLGASCMGDIGTLFPDTDDAYKDADSLRLLKIVSDRVKKAGYFVVNIDMNIIAQEPKMMMYIPKMRETLSSALNIEISAVSIKAKTKEGLDSIGNCQAIEAQASVLIENF